MKYVSKFEKVSFDQFKNDYIKAFLKGEDAFDVREELLTEIHKVYDDIKRPKRATIGSAGYDFISPVDFTLAPNESIKIPTGIRCKMDNDCVLMIFPRSSLGFNYRLWCDNCVGIIDSDYYHSDNEGHIWVKLTNNTTEGKTVDIKAGDKIVQGMFVNYGITVDDDDDMESTKIRNGGIGSTDERGY